MRILLLNTVKNFPSVYPWEGYRSLTVLHNNKVSSFRWVSCCFQASDLWSKSCEREKTRKQMQLVNHLLRCRYLVVGSQFPNLKKTERLLKKSIWAQLYVVLLSSVQSLSCVQLFATPWAVACQASMSITNSQSFFKLISIESVMPSNHLILCHPLLLPPSIFPSIRVFSNKVKSSHQVAKVLEFQLQHQSFQ